MMRVAGTGSALVLGFALGGFFDGILLHQILQWHHLLSLVPGIDALRGQVLWDGVFHALMYALAVIGLIGLWRARARGAALPGRRLLAALLTGFGAWHVADTILSHWLLGIHRIRVDSAQPLLWDLGWLVVFGLGPLLLARWIGHGGGGGPTRRAAGPALVALTAATLAAGAWSLLPPPGQALTTVVFRADRSAAERLAALAAVDARLVWSDTGFGVVVVDVAAADAWRLYGRGALIVGGAGAPAGCLGWSRA